MHQYLLKTTSARKIKCGPHPHPQQQLCGYSTRTHTQKNRTCTILGFLPHPHSHHKTTPTPFAPDSRTRTTGYGFFYYIFLIDARNFFNNFLTTYHYYVTDIYYLPHNMSAQVCEFLKFFTKSKTSSCYDKFSCNSFGWVSKLPQYSLKISS